MPSPDDKRAPAPLLPIFLIVLVDVLGLTIILPLLPFYSEHFGASPAVVGMITATYAFFQLFSGPFLGAASDRTGRRPLLLVSQAGTFAGFLVLAFANSLWMVFLGRILDGITAGNLSLAQAYISDVTSAKDRAKSFGVIGIAFGIGFLIGPALSGFLAGYSYRWPVFVAAGLSLTSIVCTFFLLPQSPPRPEGEEEGAPPSPGGQRLGLLQWGKYLDYFRRPDLGALLLQFFLFALMFATFTGGFALFAERRYTWHGHAFGPKQVGYVFAYVGFLGILLQGGALGRLVKRFGEHKLILVGFLTAGIGYLLLGETFAIWELLAVATLSSFGNGVLRPSLTSLITQSASRSEQGVVLGLTQSLTSVAQIIAPLGAGFLIDHRLLAPWAWVAGGFALSAFVVAAATRPARRRAASAA